MTQPIPSRWVDAFQAEDAAGKGVEVHSWVEDVLVDVLRVGTEVIGQEYVSERMGWGKRTETTVDSDVAKSGALPVPELGKGSPTKIVEA